MSLAVEELPVAMSPRLTREPPFTPEDVLALENEGLFELDNGVLVEKSMSALSSVVSGLFIKKFGLWAETHHDCFVVPEHTFQCFPHRPAQVRRPDVAVILADNAAAIVATLGHIRTRPNVVVEVTSPNDLIYELLDRVSDYESAGVPLILIAHPSKRQVEVRRPDGTVALLKDTDTLTAEPILPGFSVKVADLFPPVPAPATKA